MNNKGVKTPAVLPWIPGGVDKKDSRNKYVHKKSEGRIRIVCGAQGSAKMWSPGCVNAAGKARQKWSARTVNSPNLGPPFSQAL